MYKKFFVIIAVIVLLFSISGQVLAADSTEVTVDIDPNYGSKNIDFGMSIFWQVYNYIQRDSYYGPVADRPLFYNAMKGLVRALKKEKGDPYACFYDPQEFKEYQRQWSQEKEFGGVGFFIRETGNQFIVVSIIPGTPAEKGNLCPGDKIIAVDGLSTDTLDMSELLDLIGGQVGTEVTLTIKKNDGIFRTGREGITSSQEKIKNITLTRDRITLKSFEWKIINDVVYIQLRRFSETASNDFIVMANEFCQNNPGQKFKLILDLRNNKGGFSEYAVKIATLWLGNQVVLTFQNRHGQTITHRGDKNITPWFKDWEIVVLVNKETASASEMLAAALQDYNQAILVGEKSFGKGCAQEVYQLIDGSAIIVTTYYWFSPKGRLIEGQGLEPDIEVEMTLEDYIQGRDPQLEKALEIIRNTK